MMPTINSIVLLIAVLGCLIGVNHATIPRIVEYPAPVPMYFPDCVNGPMSTFPICNAQLPAQVRVQDLLDRLNIPEKVFWLGNSVPAIERLGIPAYQWWEEALHGLAYCPGNTFDYLTPNATQFPMPIGTASSFNRTLFRLIGEVISDEARAFSNVQRAGFDFWTPNINIFRDPRWGRGRETPGEDPYTTSQYLHALITGLQVGEDPYTTSQYLHALITGLQVGEDPRYLKIIATCKHYNAYDMESSDDTDRFHFNAIVTEQDLVETFSVPFEACVDAGVKSMMCSFNSLNGVPMCANDYEINQVARGQWGFDGYITSDCGAVNYIYTAHNWVTSDQAAVPAALRGGCDIDCGNEMQTWGVLAWENGFINTTDLDIALGRAFKTLLLTGWFDDPKTQYYRTIGLDHVNSKYNQQVALESARQSVVLLKNNNNFLPLTITKGMKIAVVGPNANDTTALQVMYYGPGPYLITPVMALQKLGVEVLYAYGCDLNSTNQTYFADAVAAAQASDYTIYVGGTNADQEQEGQDRYYIDLPGQQWTLIKHLEKASKTPIIVAILSGGPLDLTYSRDSNLTGAMLWHGNPGQSGGTGLMDVIFGNFNPAGRLTMTWYNEDFINQVKMTDMNMRPGPYNPGRTYKFYTGTPVFPFGFGLSYTTFSYVWSDDGSVTTITTDRLAKLAYNGENENYKAVKVPLISYSVNVTNIGKVAGDDAVIAFASASIDPELRGFDDPPISTVYGFDRITLQPGQSGIINFDVSLSTLLIVNKDGSKWLVPGTYTTFLGHDRKIERILIVKGDPVLWDAGRAEERKRAYKTMHANRLQWN